MFIYFMGLRLEYNTILRDVDYFLQDFYFFFSNGALSIITYSNILFFFFILLVLTYNVVFLYDPIYSLLSLICLISLLCMYWIYLGLDFLGLIFLMVYVGAIAILFLFAIMMLNLHTYSITTRSIKPSKFNWFTVILFIGLSFLFLFLFFLFWLQIRISGVSGELNFFVNTLSKLHLYLIEWNHFKALGLAFYSKYAIYLLLSGLILFLGMAGPIILTFETSAQSYFVNYKHLNSQTYRTWLLNIRKKVVSK